MMIVTDGIRLLMGLLAGATVGIVVGMGIDVTSSAASMLGGVVAALTGLSTTLLLRAWYPRRERPSRAGAGALLLLLCCYLVVAPMVWQQLGPRELGFFGAAAAVLVWLVFTSVAEPAVFIAFVLGGLAGAFLGVVGPVVFRQAFQPLLAEVVGKGQVSLVYSALGLLGALSGAIAAVAGRLSGWGLEGRSEEVWKFDDEGRVESPDVP